MKTQKKSNAFETKKLTDEQLNQIVGGQVQAKGTVTYDEGEPLTISLMCTASSSILNSASEIITATVNIEILEQYKNNGAISNRPKIVLDGIQMYGLQVDGLPNDDSVYYCTSGIKSLKKK